MLVSNDCPLHTSDHKLIKKSFQVFQFNGLSFDSQLETIASQFRYPGRPDFQVSAPCFTLVVLSFTFSVDNEQNFLFSAHVGGILPCLSAQIRGV